MKNEPSVARRHDDGSRQKWRDLSVCMRGQFMKAMAGAGTARPRFVGSRSIEEPGTSRPRPFHELAAFVMSASIFSLETVTDF